MAKKLLMIEEIDAQSIIFDPTDNKLKAPNTGVNCGCAGELVTYSIEPANPNVNVTFGELVYNTATKLGIVNLNFTPSVDVRGQVLLGRLPIDAPKALTTMEVTARGTYTSTHGGGTAPITVEKGTDRILLDGGVSSGSNVKAQLIGYFDFGETESANTEQPVL